MLTVKTLYFYASRRDVLRLCAGVEAEQELSYTLAGELELPQPICYASALDIPSLGIAQKGQILRECRYLALKRGAAIRVLTDTRSDGSNLYFVGQKQNPHSVEFRPGGFYKENSIIQGTMGTIAKSPPSVKLYRLFQKVLGEQFSLIRGIYVGAEALEFGKQGMRLTQSIKQPTDIDLKIP